MKAILKVLAFVLGAVAFFCVGFTWKDIKNQEAPSAESFQRLISAEKRVQLTPTQLFKNHYTHISNSYYRPVDVEQLKYAGMNGLMASLGDPHTIFMEPKISADFQTGTSGNFVGIGTRLEPDPLGAKIVSPFPNGPADKAGMKAGDIIVAIDGKSTANQDVDDLVTKIRGEEGTVVRISVSRQGVDEPIVLTIRRARVFTPTVESRVLPGTTIGYLSISEFSEPTASQFDESLQKLMSAQISGLIIDLRSNGGGLLESATEILSRFVADRVVVKMKRRNGEEKVVKTFSGIDRELKIPIAVLVNEESASAAEIMAGVLKDYRIATLVGEHTYGKASVQQVFPMADGSSAKITTARYFLPSGTDISRTVDEEGQYISGGLKADVRVELETRRGVVVGDIRTDNQLQAAVKVVKGEPVASTPAAPPATTPGTP